MKIGNRVIIFFIAFLFIFGSLTLVYSQNSGQGITHYAGNLHGFHQVPAVSTLARGGFTANIDYKNKKVKYRLNYYRLEGDVLQAHVYFGQRNVNGGVIAFLCANGDTPVPVPTGLSVQNCPQSGQIEGILTEADVLGPPNQGIAAGEFDKFVNALHRGKTYINVHSSKFVPGELRDQVLPIFRKITHANR